MTAKSNFCAEVWPVQLLLKESEGFSWLDIGAWGTAAWAWPQAAEAVVTRGLAVLGHTVPVVSQALTRMCFPREVGGSGALHSWLPPCGSHRHGCSCLWVRRNPRSRSSLGFPGSRAWDKSLDTSHLFGTWSREALVQ